MEENSKQLIHKLNKCIYLYKYKTKLEKREEEYKNSILRLKSGILMQNMKMLNMTDRKKNYEIEAKFQIENNLRRLSQYSLNQLELTGEHHFQRGESNKKYEMIIENLNGEIEEYRNREETMNKELQELREFKQKSSNTVNDTNNKSSNTVNDTNSKSINIANDTNSKSIKCSKEQQVIPIQIFKSNETQQIDDNEEQQQGNINSIDKVDLNENSMKTCCKEQIDVLENKVNILETQLNEANRKSDNKTAQIRKYEQELKKKTKKITAIQLKYEKQKKKIKKETTTLSDDFFEKSSHFNDEINLLKEEINRKNNLLEQQNVQTGIMRTELENKKQKIISLEEKDRSNKKTEMEREAEIKKLNRVVKELRRKNEEFDSSKTLESLSNKIDEIISINNENKKDMKRSREFKLKEKMKRRIRKLKQIEKRQKMEIKNTNKNNAPIYYEQLLRLKDEIINRLTVYANRARRAQFEQRSVSVYDHGEYKAKPNVPRALNTVPQIIDTELMEVRKECEKNLEILHNFTDDKWFDIYSSFKKIKRGRIIVENPQRTEMPSKKVDAYEKITSILKPNTLQCDLDFRNNLKIFMKKLDRFNNPEVVRLNINLGIANKYVDEMIEIKKVIEKNQ